MTCHVKVIFRKIGLNLCLENHKETLIYFKYAILLSNGIIMINTITQLEL